MKHPKNIEREYSKPQSFYNFILKMTSHHLCHILLVTSDSISPVYPQGRGLIQGCECQEAVIIEGHLGNCRKWDLLRLSKWHASSFTSRYMPNRNAYVCTPRSMYQNVHSSIICNGQKLVTMQMSIRIK